MNWTRYGEEGIRIVFGKAINADVHEKVRRYYFFLRSLDLQEIIDIIPSFTTCVVHFDSRLISFDTLVSRLQEKGRDLPEIQVPAPATRGPWTGDVWKAWVKWRAMRDDLDMVVVNLDSGCGVITRGKQKKVKLPAQLKGCSRST